MAVSAADMASSRAELESLLDRRCRSVHWGPGTCCQDNPARVTGGVAGGGRSAQQGSWEQEIHGDPDRQTALSLELSGSSKQEHLMDHMEWLRLSGRSFLSFSILSCEKL